MAKTIFIINFILLNALMVYALITSIKIIGVLPYVLSPVSTLNNSFSI